MAGPLVNLAFLTKSLDPGHPLNRDPDLDHDRDLSPFSLPISHSSLAPLGASPPFGEILAPLYIELEDFIGVGQRIDQCP